MSSARSSCSGSVRCAEQVAAKLGVATESVIAHAALETGWGRSLPADAGGGSNNYFGIKAGASWRGDRVAAHDAGVQRRRCHAAGAAVPRLPESPATA